MKHSDYMEVALVEARMALEAGEVPVGALIVKDGKILSRAHNKKETWHHPTAHAEILVIREACKQVGDWRLNGCVLYVTLEPCAMCASAILQARISILVYGARDDERGAVESRGRMLCDDLYNHQLEVLSGFLEHESQNILEKFFSGIR